MRPALPTVALLALLVGYGTAAAGEYVVEISGSEGTPFGGVCLTITGNARVTRPIAGTAPSTFGLSGDIVSCAIQRKAGRGELRIAIRRAGGDLVNESVAPQPFGVVMAAGR